MLSQGFPSMQAAFRDPLAEASKAESPKLSQLLIRRQSGEPPREGSTQEGLLDLSAQAGKTVEGRLQF